MKRRGSTMIESTLVATVFLLLLVAIMEFGRLGFAYNSVSFAAHRAARYAALRGSTSGHAVSAADVQAEAGALLVGLDPAQITIQTIWLPDNRPDSTVQVTVSYGFRTLLVPLSAGGITLATTSRQLVVQ